MASKSLKDPTFPSILDLSDEELEKRYEWLEKQNERYRLRLALNYMDGKLPMTGLSPARTVPCPAHTIIADACRKRHPP